MCQYRNVYARQTRQTLFIFDSFPSILSVSLAWFKIRSFRTTAHSKWRILPHHSSRMRMHSNGFLRHVSNFYFPLLLNIVVKHVHSAVKDHECLQWNEEKIARSGATSRVPSQKFPMSWMPNVTLYYSVRCFSIGEEKEFHDDYASVSRDFVITILYR